MCLPTDQEDNSMVGWFALASSSSNAAKLTHLFWCLSSLSELTAELYDKYFLVEWLPMKSLPK